MHSLRRRPRPAVRLGTLALTAGLALAVAGCSHENDAATDEAEVQAEPSVTRNPPSAVRDYPDFAPADYTYRLEVLCYCPQVGAVRVTVKDGKVVSAKTITATSGGKGGGIPEGTDAPEFARLSINDIIARANDPQVDEAEVTWPAGQDHPSAVSLDQLKMATDDEVTYTIKNVVLSEE